MDNPVVARAVQKQEVNTKKFDCRRNGSRPPPEPRCTKKPLTSAIPAGYALVASLPTPISKKPSRNRLSVLPRDNAQRWREFPLSSHSLRRHWHSTDRHTRRHHKFFKANFVCKSSLPKVILRPGGPDIASPDDRLLWAQSTICC